MVKHAHMFQPFLLILHLAHCLGHVKGWSTWRCSIYPMRDGCSYYLTFPRRSWSVGSTADCQSRRHNGTVGSIPQRRKLRIHLPTEGYFLRFGRGRRSRIQFESLRFMRDRELRIMFASQFLKLD